jgi:glycosyltransferase involved in cell wall biosynthesis
MSRHRWRSRTYSDDAGCRVSVVVPVYNTGEHIHDLVRSLDGQTMPQDRFEVIWVDDGSTDTTGVLLDLMAAERPNWVVRHIPNSGWPGTPRNVGLDLARGRYVAFVDHDDYLAKDGLRRVCDFADKHASDVVVAKEVGVGRSIGRFMFRRTVPNARLDREPLLRLLTPHKVYRRSMLQENGIRFPEGKVRLEDHLFNVKAYFAARRISLYSDHPYYYWTRRDGHLHASSDLKDPHEYVEVAVNAVLDVVDANTEPGPYRDRIASHWLEKKLLPLLASAPMVHYPDEYRRSLFEAVRTLVLRRYPEESDRLLPFSSRVRVHLLRAGRLDDMVALAEVEQQVTTHMASDRVLWDRRDAVVHLAIDLVHRDDTPVELERRDGRLLWAPPGHLGEAGLPDAVLDVTDEVRDAKVLLLAQRRGAPGDFTVQTQGAVELVPLGEGNRVRLAYRGAARVPLDDLLRLSPREGPFVVDLSVEFTVLGWRSLRRVHAPDHLSSPLTLPDEPTRATFYTTEMGNLSLRVRRPAHLPPRVRPTLAQRLRPRRVARAVRRRLRVTVPSRVLGRRSARRR